MVLPQTLQSEGAFSSPVPNVPYPVACDPLLPPLAKTRAVIATSIKYDTRNTMAKSLDKENASYYYTERLINQIVK
jgi:hypothetical protein